MFRHHTENSPSTGEPPTPPLSTRSGDRLTPNDRTRSSRMFFESSLEPSDRGRSNTIPSQDSGYEMSPNNQNDTQEFFTELDVFEDGVASDELCRECSDDELCSECGEEYCQCLRSHSSRTTVRSCRTPSNLCDMFHNSESSSSYRPSSSCPIAIPAASTRPSTMLPSSSFSWRHRQRHSPASLPVALPTSPHLPVFQEFLSRSQPRMWPTVLPSHRQNAEDVFNRGINSTPDRLGSFSSSIESFFDLEPLDGVRDDVFQDSFYEMAEEDVSFHPTTDYRRRLNSEATPQPLPDLLLHASPRRSRSASVNLPPDHAVLRDIGRSLRRISDDFQTRRSGQQQIIATIITDYRRRLNSEATPQPLPDLLLHASPRRSRSASVNLPPDHAVLRDIGRSLRRISDDFQTRRSGQQQQSNGATRGNRPVFKLFKKFDHP